MGFVIDRSSEDSREMEEPSGVGMSGLLAHYITILIIHSIDANINRQSQK